MSSTMSDRRLHTMPFVIFLLAKLNKTQQNDKNESEQYKTNIPCL